MKSKRRVGIVAAAFVIFLSIGSVYAYDPPAGGTLVPVLPSAHALAQGPTVTAMDAPWADWLNPAASAAQQRPALEASYVGLTDFGQDGQGWGSAASLGLSLPKPYAVWGAGLRFISVPDSMSSLPLGTFIQGRGGIAKDLFANFFVGAGVDLTLGDGGWGAGANLGVLQLAGPVGFLKDVRWGATLANIGKGYGSELSGTGLFGGEQSLFPPPFTFSVGAQGLFLSTADLKAGLGLNLSAPSFADLEACLSASFTWRDVVSLRAAWDLSARELAEGSDGRSLIPAVGLTASIPLQGKKADPRLAKQGWDKADLKPALSISPLYGDLWALGFGATLPLGTVDKTAPKIKAEFPASSFGPAYISPNNDGTKDLLEIPLSIKDERYVVGWTFTVSDATGQVVRRIYNKESRPETEGFKGLTARPTNVKKAVSIPEKLD